MENILKIYLTQLRDGTSAVTKITKGDTLISEYDFKTGRTSFLPLIGMEEQVATIIKTIIDEDANIDIIEQPVLFKGVTTDPVYNNVMHLDYGADGIKLD